MTPLPPAIVEVSPLALFWEEFSASKMAVAGLGILVVIILAGLFAPWISPQNPYDLAQLDVLDGKLAPGEQSMGGKSYVLGTDDQGRDMLSGIFYGLRISLLVGVASTLFAAVIGLVLGLLAAFAGGWVDTLIMRVVDIQLSFPAILLALILLAVFGQGVDKVIIALITVQWAYYARTVRASALVERQKEYVEAAKAAYDAVTARGGSFSAEHGIGALKIEELEKRKSPVAVALMRSIKQALDPAGTLNPRRVVR